MRDACIRGLRAAAVGLATVLVLSGCEFRGVQELPLPGGADVGDDPYEVKVEFADVLDLVPESAVKVNDVSVGRVADVELDGWNALVTLEIRGDVKLPDNTVAGLRQTSLLGEKFVSLSPPADEQPAGRLSNGDLIPLDRSGRNPEVEEVLSALSLLLNGGGVDQLQTINRELANVMEGREQRIKSVLSRLDTFIGELDEHKAEIVRAIDGLDRLSAELVRQRDAIEVAVEDIGPGLDVLTEQRRELTKMLQALSDLGEVGTRVIERSKEDTIADLQALQPILQNLARSGRDLPRALELLVSYPFPSTVFNGVRGDYTNLRVTADLDLRTIFSNLQGEEPPESPLPAPPQQEQTDPTQPTPPDIKDPRDVVPELCKDIPESVGLPPVCKKDTKIKLPQLSDVMTGLCSLIPKPDRPASCPKRLVDKDDDGKTDVCVIGLVCTDRKAPLLRDGTTEDAPAGDGGGGDSGTGDGGLLCPPICAGTAKGDDLTQLLLGGLA